MSSVVIESWTAFETMASDLWVAAVDNGPPQIAQRVNLSRKLENPDDQIAQDWKDKLEYDPRRYYGSALREVGRVSFRRLDRIVQYYSIAFENRVTQLFKTVADGYIYALAAYRNSLIHNGGRVDKTFVKQIGRLDALRGQFKLNERLSLDGESVRKLRDAGIRLGVELLASVDAICTPL